MFRNRGVLEIFLDRVEILYEENFLVQDLCCFLLKSLNSMQNDLKL
jgi:hypothetical protein